MASPTARDWMARGYRLPGERHHAARKIAGPQIDEIRAAHADGATVADLALRYGVSTRTIRHYIP